MEQRQLLNFLCACEEKHITRAADRHFITRQGLSRGYIVKRYIAWPVAAGAFPGSTPAGPDMADANPEVLP
jgi:hypothetical protein